MAINACTIDGFTINSRRCANKFAALIPILHPLAPIQNGVGNPRVHRDTFVPPREEQERFDTQFQFEQPIVTVSAEIFGFSGSDTQDVSAAQVDFVSVTEFRVQDDEQVLVNITEFRFE